MSEEQMQSVSVEGLLGLDLPKVTLVDLREPDEVLVKEIEGAVNIPFSRISKDLENLPIEKPVYLKKYNHFTISFVFMVYSVTGCL
jgi:rhodanese-related sulfurtransferase